MHARDSWAFQSVRSTQFGAVDILVQSQLGLVRPRITCFGGRSGSTASCLNPFKLVTQGCVLGKVASLVVN